MEIVLVIVFMLLGLCSGILIVSGIRKIILARKPVDTKLGEQRIRDITAEDLGYPWDFPHHSISEKKEITPVERSQEFTGIRAIQL